MQRAAGNGGLIMMHAENGIAIDVLVEQALAEGRTDPATTGTSARSPWRPRPPPRRPARPRRGSAPLRRPCLRRRGRRGDRRRPPPGLPVFGETCPQYLFLSTDNLAEPGFEGAKYVCSTPLPQGAPGGPVAGPAERRTPGRLHRPLPFCFSGQKEMGRGDFSKIPNGMPGVEHRMDLLHQAVVDGHITRRRWIEIACASPARMFGLYPRKGTIAPARTPTSSSTTRTPPRCCRPRPTTMKRRLLRLRGQDGHGPGRDGHVPGRGRRRPGHVHRPSRPRHVRAPSTCQYLG